MNSEIVIALISLAGTLLGTFGGILTTGRLTIYRISQLEKKVEKHNNLVERMTKVESSTASAHHRIDELRHDFERTED